MPRLIEQGNRRLDENISDEHSGSDQGKFLIDVEARNGIRASFGADRCGERSLHQIGKCSKGPNERRRTDDGVDERRA